jgi:hypothetical protein
VFDTVYDCFFNYVLCPRSLILEHSSLIDFQSSLITHLKMQLCTPVTLFCFVFVVLEVFVEEEVSVGHL